MDVRRLLTEAMPRMYNNNPQELARVNAEIDEFKARYGLDARQFDRLSVGARFAQAASGATRVEPVAIAHGTFNSGALVGAARLALNGKYTEQKHAGRSVYVFSVNDRVKLLGLFNLRVTELAVAALDGNTLAVGQPERVRAAIDAAAGRGRLSAEIAQLATRDPNAVIGLGGNVPATLTRGLNFFNAEISRSVASIRQFYGTFGTTAAGLNLQLVARAETAGAAKTLSDTILGLKQFAPFAISRLPTERARRVQSLVDSARVSAQGNEVQISLDVAQGDVAALIEAF